MDSQSALSPHIGRLLFGVLFLTIGIFGAFEVSFSKAWLWVGLLAAAGVAGLVSVVGVLAKERRAD